MVSETEMEVRDDICGEVARAVLAATGEKCGARTTKEVVDQLNDIRGVKVADWRDSTERRAHDDRDFIDLYVENDSSSGHMFSVLTRNGFVPSALSGNWGMGASEDLERRVVLQWKR